MRAAAARRAAAISRPPPWPSGSTSTRQGWVVKGWSFRWGNQDLLRLMCAAHLQVLERCLRGSLHHAQYVKQLREVVDFLVQHNQLTMEQLAAIWQSQVGW